jgi:hypothetical protein
MSQQNMVTLKNAFAGSQSSSIDQIPCEVAIKRRRLVASPSKFCQLPAQKCSKERTEQFHVCAGSKISTAVTS